MSAAIKANNFADLRAQLTTATDDVVKATEAYWAALPGVIAANARHLIDEEIEVRQAVARLEHITAKPGCPRCGVTPGDRICCSRHRKRLCHYCYRVTHSAEVCVAGCRKCAAENLTENLADVPDRGW
ncbi:hypothetical protein JNW90_08995 [Micromonospora sp. STR1s_5]|nr:hypothetical protein [Micromonospora sp. STR1s_5]